MKIKIVKNKLLKEDFYFQKGFNPDDKETHKPLAVRLVNLISKRLAGRAPKQIKPIKASGAEGIVVSIDDKRVVKLFHSLENAAKNLHLVSRNVPETAQVYSMGKIILNDPVVYFKYGSMHNKLTLENPTKQLWFIVMQRVIPDPYIYLYVEEEWDRLTRITRLDMATLALLYNTGIRSVQQKIDFMFNDIIENHTQTVNQKIIRKIQNEQIKSFADLINDKKAFRQFESSFGQYKKTRKREFIINILNIIGQKQDLSPTETLSLLDLFRSLPKMQKRASRTSNYKKDQNATLVDDFDEIVNLVKQIRVDQKLEWNDIHREQFGRNLKGDLVGLDLGIKNVYSSDKERREGIKKADAQFAAGNVIRVGTGFNKENEPVMQLNEQNNNIKTLNVFDFDKTLFWTSDKRKGIKQWEQSYGQKYPHKGWFGRAESLDVNLNIEVNQMMKTVYDVLKSEPDSLCVLNSNRYIGLKRKIEEFLNYHGFFMDEILLKYGQVNKGQRLQDYWENYPEVQVINCFDDKDESLQHYIKLRERYSIYREDLKFNIFKVTKDGIVKI